MAATEIDIPDFLCSKKGEREDHGLSSEILEEKVKLEIRSQVAETVNKQLETDVLTNESGTFFQALSVPVVSADDEGTPESCKAATTEDQIVSFKENSQEDIREQKPEEGVNKTVESHVESEEQAVKSDKNEEELDEEAVMNNDGQTKKSESPLVKEACEVTGSEKDEIQEGLKDTDSFSTTLNENELVSKEEKEQEVKMSEEVKGGGDDVISSQNASSVETEESEKCDNGEEEKREQSVNDFVESSSEIEQKEDTEEIKSSVEPEEKTESHVESAENEVKSDDNEKENFESPSVKEVCENEKEISSKVDVTNSQNAASEDMKETTIGQHVTTYDAQEVSEECENEEKDKTEQIDSSSSVETKENEENIDEVNEIVSKDENQEEEVKGGEDDVISSLNASSDDIKETTISQQTTTVEVEDKLNDAHEDKNKEKPEEIVSKDVESCSKIEQEEEDIEEIKPSVETEEKTEQQGLLHEVTTADCITTQTESQVDTSEHEVKTNEAIQSEDSQKEIFNKLNENEIASKVEDQEKEEEVISSQDAVFEDIKETAIDQHVTSVAYFEENQPKEIINEETEEKSSDAQEACEEQKPEESVGEIVQPYSESEQKKDAEEPKPSCETEQQEVLHAAITDDVTTSQTESQVESAKCEVKNDEAIQTDDGQKENFNNPLVKEVCEETGLEKVESEQGLKLAESSNNTLNESDIASKIEDQEKEQEVYVSTSSQDATCEDIKETTISQHVTSVANVDEEQSLSSMPKEILKEEVENKSSDAQEETKQYENGEDDKRDQDPQESVSIAENTEEIKPSVETYETKEQVEITRHEEGIESDDGQKEKSKNLAIKEVCEETDTQKVEVEGVELSNKDESQEKEQEPIMPEQEQGEDTVRYSKDATSAEELQVKNYDGEENEPEVVKTREYTEEDTEEIIYSVETKVIEEKIDAEAIVNEYGQTKKSESPLVKEVCEETDTKKVELEGVELSDKDENQEKKQELVMSEQDQEQDTVIYSQDETSTEDLQVKNYKEDTEEVISSVETKEMEEKIDEEAIVNDYGRTKKSESPLVEEVCEVIGSENADSEEGITYFESSNRTLNQDEIVSKEENQEKEQEPEEVQGGRDDVISSSKDIKETSDAYEDKTEEKPEESINRGLQSCSDTKQEEDTEEIKPNVEIEQQGLFHAITSQTESQIESADAELKSDELIQSDDGQKKKVDNSLVNEVCEETDSKKVEYNEEVKETANENDIASKVEEVKNDESIQSDDGQKENVDTSSINEVCEEIDSKKVEYSEEVQETANQIEIVSKVEEVKTDELIQSDDGQKEIVYNSSVNEVCEETVIEKVEYSEEVKETTIENENANKVEEVKSDEPTQSDDGQKENVDSSSVNEVCKETDSQKVEYSQEVQETANDDEIASKVEEVKTDEPIQSDDDQKETVDSSSVNEVCEETDSRKVEYNQEVQETVNGNEIASKVESVKTDEPIESDDGQKETVDSSSVNEVCEETDSKKVEYTQEVKVTAIEDETASKVEEVKNDEPIQSDGGQKEIVDSSSVNEVCEETDSKKVEYSEEVKETANENEIASKVEEVKSDEPIQNDDGQTENVDTSLVNEVCVETDSKNFEYSQEVRETVYENDIATDKPIQSDDGQKENVDSSLVNEACEETDSKKVDYSEEVKETAIENEIANKVEDEEKEQEVYMPQDEKCEDIKEPKVGEHVTTQALSSIPKDFIKEETEEKSSDAQEEVCLSEQTESQKETTQSEEKNEEIIENDDGQVEKSLIPSVNEVYEETTKEVCDESKERVKAIENFKDEDEEKDQEVNKSIDDQGKDNVTSSQVAALEDDLQNESNQDKGKEPEFVETRESIEEDTEEIKSSVETIEDTHVISTDIRSSTQTETTENEEKIEEEPIVNDDGQIKKSESLLVKEVCEVISSEKAESELNENEDEIVSKEEILEKEQELEMSEEVKGVEDSNMKEECLSTITHVDEEKETETKEIPSEEKTEQITEIGESISLYVKEEVTQEDQTNSTEDCSEISKDVIFTKEVQKGTDDLKEQIVEEDNHSTELQEKSTEDQKADVISYLEPLESDESPKQALESVCDVQTPEVVADLEDSKVKEEGIECTDEKNGEEEREVKTNEIASAENLELHGELKPTSELVIDEDQVEKKKSESEQPNIMENVILTEKDLEDEKTSSNEKELTDEMSSELGQPKGQIVEEIQEGQTKTISEIIEDEITKTDEILSNDTTTKDENCFQDERTREIETVEEHNDDLDEVSKQISTDLNETTTEVEPQEDIVPSSSLVTSTEDTPNSEKPKAENDNLPTEDSVYDEQIPEVVSMSEDSNLKEDCVTSETETYVDEEKETVTKEILSDKKAEQITVTDEGDSLYEKGDMKEDVTQENQLNSTKDCSQISKDVILTEEVPLKIQKKKETDDLKEQIVEEDTEDQKEMAHVISYSDPIPVGISEVKTDEFSSTETTESKQVVEYPSISSLDAAVIEENLRELKPTSESVIEEDKVKETKPEQEQSDITYENITKDTSEKDLVYGKRDMEDDVTIAPENEIDNTENQNETIKNVILTDEVVVDTEKEKEHNEVKKQVSEEDICPTELDKASTSNQKELADEIEYSKPIPSGNNEVKEVKAESPTELENIQAAETPETTLKMEMKEEHLEATNDACETHMDGSSSEKKLESIVPSEELTFSTTEDQTTEPLQETETTLEEDANKEKETVGQSHADEPMKTTSDSILRFTEQSIAIGSEESKGYADIHKLEENPTEVSNEEYSEIQQQHISKKEAILEENQSDQKKEADKSTEREIPTEKESVELDAYVSVTHGTAATEELEISHKDITDDIVNISQNQPDIQKYEDSACIVDNQSPAEPHQNESVERKLLTGNKDEQHEQKEPTEKPLIAEPESKASSTESQCSSEAFKEEKKMSDEKEKSRTVLLDDMLHEQTKGNSEVAENLIKEREIDFTKEQEVSKEETSDKGAKTDDENEEEDDKDNQMIDDPVMVEASKDIDVKVHKKSHNILSGVGSKVKHSIAKVKKAITGKSSSPKPPSPKEKDQVIT